MALDSVALLQDSTVLPITETQAEHHFDVLSLLAGREGGVVEQTATTTPLIRGLKRETSGEQSNHGLEKNPVFDPRRSSTVDVATDRSGRCLQSSRESLDVLTILRGLRICRSEQDRIILWANIPSVMRLETDNGYTRADVNTIHDFLSANLQNLTPLNYEQIWGNYRVVSFGEHHDVMMDKDQIIQHLQEFRDRFGLTHVALEMFPASAQPLLDRYMLGQATREEVLAALNEQWYHGPAVSERIMQLLDAIRDLGLTPVALDLPFNRGGHTPAGMNLRNQQWARIVAQVLQNNPNARILVFGGSAHFIDYRERPATSGPIGAPLPPHEQITSVNTLLARVYGIQSASVFFLGAQPPRFDTPMNMREAFSLATRRLGRQLETFVIPVSVGHGSLYYVHLPQTEGNHPPRPPRIQQPRPPSAPAVRPHLRPPPIR